MPRDDRPRADPGRDSLWQRYDGTPIGALHRWLRTPPPDLKPEFADFYALSNCTHALGLLSHVLFLILFTVLRIDLLAWLNVGSVAIFLATLRWSKRGQVNLALLVGGLEVAVHQGLAVLVLGLQPAFQHYILILAVGTLFYHHIPLLTRIGMAILPIIGYIGITVTAMHLQPWVELSPLVRDGLAAMNVVFFVTILMGICVYFQHTVEAARIHAEKMSQSKTLFLANMSHELRTPLNAILGFARILKRSPSLATQEQRHLATIDRSGEHLLELINDILDMSKLEEGKVALHSQPCDPRQMLEDLRTMFALAARDRDLDLSVEAADDLPSCVAVDALRLRQVLINLLGNALKFTERGGIRLTAARLPKAGEQVWLRFTVCDSGGGIAPEEQGDLFQLFTQAELGRQSRRGTGLGLALSRRFIELMGGRIGVESEVGRGSVFWFEIPVAPATPSAIQAAVVPVSVAGRRMLVVDDNPENRDVLAQALVELGCVVETANDGAEGVAAWRRFAPDLVWMDLRMPVMDGYAACQAIREAAQQSGQAAPRVVAVTASSLGAGRERMHEAGFAAWLGKPFREAELHDILRRNLPPLMTAGAEAPTSATAQADEFAARCARLPGAQRAALAQAADRTDFAAAQEAIASIAATEPALAERLTQLLELYRFDRLHALMADAQVGPA